MQGAPVVLPLPVAPGLVSPLPRTDGAGSLPSVLWAPVRQPPAGALAAIYPPPLVQGVGRGLHFPARGAGSSVGQGVMVHQVEHAADREVTLQKSNPPFTIHVTQAADKELSRLFTPSKPLPWPLVAAGQVSGGRVWCRL